MRLALALLLLAVGPAVADLGDEHPIQALYRTAPCTETVATIDAPLPEDVAGALSILPDKAMAWGYLLAFDALHPKAKGSAPTLLMRLRSDCSASPDTPAGTILRRYVED